MAALRAEGLARLAASGPAGGVRGSRPADRPAMCLARIASPSGSSRGSAAERISDELLESLLAQHDTAAGTTAGATVATSERPAGDSPTEFDGADDPAYPSNPPGPATAGGGAAGVGCDDAPPLDAELDALQAAGIASMDDAYYDSLALPEGPPLVPRGDLGARTPSSGASSSIALADDESRFGDRGGPRYPATVVLPPLPGRGRGGARGLAAAEDIPRSPRWGLQTVPKQPNPISLKPSLGDRLRPAKHHGLVTAPDSRIVFGHALSQSPSEEHVPAPPAPAVAVAVLPARSPPQHKLLWM